MIAVVVQLLDFGHVILDGRNKSSVADSSSHLNEMLTFVVLVEEVAIHGLYEI